MNSAGVPLVDLSPALRLLGGAALGAAALLAWQTWRVRGQGAARWLASLTGLTLFLTFDLIVFGSFTRLTDSGLGCPDWPGCYGEASPWGARADIAQAQAAMPSGPVTFTKAWIEMIHRYLAMTVGALILVMAVASLALRKRLPHSPAWPLMTLVWVIVQGLFGKYTVTLKLYPAVVTLHLLGGMVLLALLVVQYLRWRPQLSRLLPTDASGRPKPLGQARPANPTKLTGLRALAWASTAALWVQVALGGWVSTNYAVLACRTFPSCNGQWWPDMQLAEGFVLWRHLGERGQGKGLLSFDALVGIHMVHRMFAVVLLALLLTLAWHLWRRRVLTIKNGDAAARWPAWAVLGLALWQLASGLTNVVLGWPLAAALAHSAGAAALIAVLTSLCVLLGRTPERPSHQRDAISDDASGRAA